MLRALLDVSLGHRGLPSTKGWIYPLAQQIFESPLAESRGDAKGEASLRLPPAPHSPFPAPAPALPGASCDALPGLAAARARGGGWKHAHQSLFVLLGLCSCPRGAAVEEGDLEEAIFISRSPGLHWAGSFQAMGFKTFNH